MSGNRKTNPTGAIWHQIEKIISDKLSQLNPAGRMANLMQEPAWVENFVSDVLNRALPAGLGVNGARTSSSSSSSSGSAKVDVFETHQHVIAKIKLPAKENPRALQVLVRSDKIKIVGLSAKDPAYISLPAPVIAKSARARYREGILEIQARKRKKGSYYEAYVEV